MNDQTKTKDDLTREIKRIIYWRTFKTRWDGVIAHFFLWTSVAASFVSAILIATNNENILSVISPKIDYKLVLSILAGLPGLIIAIEKTFDFSKRFAWGSLSIIELKALLDEIYFTDIDAITASKKFRPLQKEHEINFFKIGSFFNTKDQDGK